MPRRPKIVRKVKKFLKKRKEGKIRKISVNEIVNETDNKLRTALREVSAFHVGRELVGKHHTEISDELLHDLVRRMERMKNFKGEKLVFGVHIKEALQRVGYPARRVNRILREKGYVIQGKKVLEPHELLRP